MEYLKNGAYSFEIDKFNNYRVDFLINNNKIISLLVFGKNDLLDDFMDIFFTKMERYYITNL